MPHCQVITAWAFQPVLCKETHLGSASTDILVLSFLFCLWSSKIPFIYKYVFFQAISSMSVGCFAVTLLSLFSIQLLTLPQITPLISDGKCLLVPVFEFPSLWAASDMCQPWQDLFSPFMAAQFLWQPLEKNFIKDFFSVLNNYPVFIEHCSIMLHLLYTEFQIQLHLYPQHICMLEVSFCYFYITLLPEIVAVHLVKQGLTKPVKEVWVFFFIFEKIC